MQAHEVSPFARQVKPATVDESLDLGNSLDSSNLKSISPRRSPVGIAFACLDHGRMTGLNHLTSPGATNKVVRETANHDLVPLMMKQFLSAFVALPRHCPFVRFINFRIC